MPPEGHYLIEQYIENIISIQKLRVSSSFGLNQRNCFHLVNLKKAFIARVACDGLFPEGGILVKTAVIL